MTKRDKRLEKLRQNPKNISLSELQSVLEFHGFSIDRIVGSHHIFRCYRFGRVWKLSIPYNRPIKSIYIKQSLEAIDQILALEEENNGSDD